MSVRGVDGVVIGYVAGRFDVRVILPIVALVLVSLLTVAGLVRWTAARQDAIALDNEGRLLATALDGRLKAEAEMLCDYAFWDEAYEKLHLTRDPAWAADNIGAWAHDRLGVAATFIIAADGSSWFCFVDGSRCDTDASTWLGDLASRFALEVRSDAPDRPRARFVRLRGKLAVIAAAPVGKHTETVHPAPGTASAIVQVGWLDDADLDKLAATYLLPGLRIAGPGDAGPTPTHVLRQPDGAPIAALTWRSARPGADLLLSVLPLLGIGALALMIVTGLVLRHARDAAAAIAFSERRATQDMLTGLPNRRLFDDRLAAALARPGGVGTALLLLDLDGFKAVNDRLGHAAGDELLVQVGQRLRGLTRPGDLLARLGGDEFALLRTEVVDRAEVLRIAHEAVGAIAAPFVVEGAAVAVGLSVGIAFAPADAGTARELSRCADVALYTAKRSGKGTWALFAEAPAARPDAAAAPEGALLAYA